MIGDQTTAISPFSRSVQHDEKRQAILSEASRLFNSRGSRTTTLQDIAESLNLTKTSLYYYVKTKEELIYQCYLASCHHQADLISGISHMSLSGLEKVRAYIHTDFINWQKTRRGERPHYAMLWEIETLKKHQRQDIENRFAQSFNAMRQLIVEGIEDGSVRACDPTMAMVNVLAILAWSPMWLLGKRPDEIDGIADRACDILINGICPTNQPFSANRLPDNTNEKTINIGFDRETRNRLKREAFLKVGTWFFNRKGYKGTSLDEISQKLQVTKGAFYYHIKNKEDLLKQCYDRSLSMTEKIQTDANDSGRNGLEKVEINARKIFYVQNSDAGPLIRFITLVSLAPDIRKDIRTRIEKTSDQLGDFLRQGIDDGSLRSIDREVCEHLLSGVIYGTSELKLWKSVNNVEQDSIAYYEIIFNGLAAKRKSIA
ncbi:MAG: TetR/AcrR family transcriptional regulator [Pseudomonadales bacterium]